MKWMVPFAKLGTEQRRVVDSVISTNEHAWIKGFPGSGKTIILVHCIKEIKSKAPETTICCVVFTHALKDLVKSGLSVDYPDIPVITYFQFLEERKRYDIVVIDEIQDIPLSKLKSIQSYCKRLIIAGNTDQSIYKDGISEREINAILHPSIYYLNVIYRLTENLKEVAQAISPQTLMSDAEVHKGVNVDLLIAEGESYEEEVQWVFLTAFYNHTKLGNPAAILIKTHHEIKRFIHTILAYYGLSVNNYTKNNDFYEEFNKLMKQAELPYRYLGNNTGSLEESDFEEIIYIMTYHSAKGLDFESVFLPLLNYTNESFMNDEDLDRRLFFVACTRARSHLFLSYSEPSAHQYVSQMPYDTLEYIKI